MIGTASEIEDGSRIETDLCIVGSGPAGMAIALALDRTPIRVTVLESGGFEGEPEVQELYRGDSVGRRYFALEHCRQRYFGGSSNCWTGLCRPLDPEDFEARSWVPHSGWPFPRRELDPWYREAETLLELRGPDWDDPSWLEAPEGAPQAVPWPLVDPRVRPGLFKLSPPTRFGSRYRERLARSPNLRVVLGASVTRVGLGEGGGRVERLDVRRTTGGGGFTVAARRYVVACGGIENPRLLLASNDVHPAGVGNGHDLVGRYFLEHPHTDGEGVVLATPKAPPLSFYARPRQHDQPYWGLFQLTAAAREEARLLSAAVVPLPFRGELGGFEQALQRTIADTDAPELPLPERTMVFAFGTPSEQVPNPQSRVRLGAEKDRLGMPRAVLDWRLTAADVDSVVRTHEILAEAFAASGLARVRLTLEATAEFPDHVLGGRHHMGTTRMHADPRQGVTDGYGRVHGVGDLYVAGSSLFPTGGSANPTLTLVALALRQAAHLERELTA